MTNQERKLISAESVTEGHPDKVCDRYFRAKSSTNCFAQEYPQSHVAVETSAATGVFLVFGEVTSKGVCRRPVHRAPDAAPHRLHVF